MGQTSRSAADVHVGLMGVTTEFEQRDLGVPRRPGGLPHKTRSKTSVAGQVFPISADNYVFNMTEFNDSINSLKSLGRRMESGMGLLRLPRRGS